MPSVFQVSSNRGATWSTSSRGVRPRLLAASSTFWPCSSVPVRNRVSSPRMRWNRASESATSVV